MNAATLPPKLGSYWEGQGGIYVGDRLIDGNVSHVIAACGVKHDILDVTFARVEKVIPREIDGHTDWFAPEQEDLMLAYVNAREHFVHAGDDSIYWSRSVHYTFAWAVDLENGFTCNDNRNYEFRVRPFRSLPASTL